MKKAIVSVINDISTDQRVHRHCLVLSDHDYDVCVIGRSLRDSRPLSKPFGTIRFNLPFIKGPFFYASYNIRLFLHLLFSKADLLFSNDPDTLIPNYLVSRLKRIDLIYDSHELFTEVPEVAQRGLVKSIWTSIEKTILPKLKYLLTVNHSIAKEYAKRYGVKMEVLRNLPKQNMGSGIIRTRADLGLPDSEKLIVFQGAINVDRGTEEAIEAMKLLRGHTLLVIGSGDVLQQAKEHAKNIGVAEKVIFLGRIDAEEMMAYTRICDVGLCLPKPTNLSYELSLPNKLFEYMQAGIPVVASNLLEVSKVVLKTDIGILIPEVTPKELAQAIGQITSDNELSNKYRMNSRQAATEFVWENERKVLDKILERIDG